MDRFITADLRSGRLPEVIRRGEPAVMACHWAGLYYDGQEQGFRIFQEVVRRLHSAYDNLVWMKLSEIARYWAAKELTRIESAGGKTQLHAPFACPLFTLEVPNGMRTLTHNGTRIEPKEATGNILCFDLPKGLTEIS